MSQDIRNLILSAKLKSVDFEFEGQELTVTELSVGDFEALQSKAKGKDGEIDTVKYMVQSVIAQCKDKKTGKPIFSRTDVEPLMGLPLNSGFLKAFRDAQEKLMDDGEEVPLDE